MKSWLGTAATAAVMACTASAGPAVNHPPVEAFAIRQTSGLPSLSPDGKMLAIIQSYKGRPAAAIWKLDPANPNPVVMPHSDGLISAVKWTSNERLLITIGLDKTHFGDPVERWTRMISVDALGKNDVIMFSNQSKTRALNYSVSAVDDLAPDDPAHVYMHAWEKVDDRTYNNSMFQVDVTNGFAERVVAGGQHTSQWVMDGTGKVVARLDTTLKPLVDHLLVHTGDEWREVQSFDASGNKGVGLEGLTADGTGLVEYIDTGDLEKDGYFILNLASGAMQPLTNPNGISGTLHDPWSGRVIGLATSDSKNRYVYFDPQQQALQKGLEAAFKGMDAVAVDWDRSRQKIIVAVTGPRTPRTYYLVDRVNHGATLIAQTYGLDEGDLGERKAYDYTARDGLSIPAVLTLPPGKAAKDLPVVILPHGGPVAHDDVSFDWEAQFLANRGYAVLQPNFRGSNGYGKAFIEAGYGQWGLKMQDDITDGVKKLIVDGIADPKRICIVGGSYGGYAALAGATSTPDLYACAASWGGVSDLRKFLATKTDENGSESPVMSVWARFIGDRTREADKLDSTSPALNASKVKCPVLLVHGTADSVVRIDQSQEMESALRRAGKTVTFIPAEKESHWMETTTARSLWLTELEKFLKANIGS